MGLAAQLDVAEQTVDAEAVDWGAYDAQHRALDVASQGIVGHQPVVHVAYAGYVARQLLGLAACRPGAYVTAQPNSTVRVAVAGAWYPTLAAWSRTAVPLALTINMVPSTPGKVA